MKTFLQKLLEACEASQSLVCVGLDPDPDRMPVSDVLAFNKAIIDATKDLVCAYKPNLAFYEALGRSGLDALEGTVAYVREQAPAVMVIGDAKRGDIASSNARYARAMFEVWGFDATTVNCYGGGESLEPFLQYKDRGVFVWCRSSNPGAREFQDLSLSSGGETEVLYQWVARRAAEWDIKTGNVGLVVGATYPEELKLIRSRWPEVPLLIPGVGKQGGDLSAAVKFGVNPRGRGALINSSSGVIYASEDPADFAVAARGAAEDLRRRINRILSEEGRGW